MELGQALSSDYQRSAEVTSTLYNPFQITGIYFAVVIISVNGFTGDNVHPIRSPLLTLEASRVKFLS